MNGSISKRQSLAANAALLLTAMIWGGGFVAGKMALTGLTPFPILFWRFGLAACLCGLIFHRRIRRAPRKTALLGLGIGALQTLALSVQLVGLQYTTSAKQSFLCTAYVALVPFLSWGVLRKRPSLRAVAAGFLALGGIGCICLSESLSVSLGDGLSLMFAVLFGLQIVLVGKFVGAEVDGVQLSFFQFLAAAVLTLGLTLIQGQSLVISGGEAWAGVLYLGILNTLVAFLAQNIAQAYTSDTMASLILSLESLFGFLFSVLYYHENLTLRLLLGAALCFAAILLNAAPKPSSRLGQHQSPAKRV